MADNHAQGLRPFFFFVAQTSFVTNSPKGGLVMPRVSNKDIRRSSYRVDFIGTAVLMSFVLFATHQYLMEQITLVEALNIVFSGSVLFIVFRAVGWWVRGFQQRVVHVDNPHKAHKATHGIGFRL